MKFENYQAFHAIVVAHKNQNPNKQNESLPIKLAPLQQKRSRQTLEKKHRRLKRNLLREMNGYRIGTGASNPVGNNTESWVGENSKVLILQSNGTTRSVSSFYGARRQTSTSSRGRWEFLSLVKFKQRGNRVAAEFDFVYIGKRFHAVRLNLLVSERLKYQPVIFFSSSSSNVVFWPNIVI